MTASPCQHIVYEYHCTRCGIWRFSDVSTLGQVSCHTCGRMVSPRMSGRSLNPVAPYCASGKLHAYGVAPSAASAIGEEIAAACADGWCTLEDASRVLKTTPGAARATITRHGETVKRHKIGKAMLYWRADVLTLRDQVKSRGERG